jgi:hypothetical protein
MPGLKPVAGMRATLAGICAITWISAARPAIAQQSANDVCRPIDGGPTCTVPPAPIGSPCGCFTSVGRVAGRIEAPEKEPSIYCETRYGRCRMNSPLGTGDKCTCGKDEGTVVPYKRKVTK